MENQNVTISIPKIILKKAKHIAIDKQTSLSGLLTKALEEIVEKEESYEKAKARQLHGMENGFNLGLKGNIHWKREDIHARE